MSDDTVCIEGELHSQQASLVLERVDARTAPGLVGTTHRAASLASLLSEAEKYGFRPGPILQIDRAESAAAIMLYRDGVPKPEWDAYISSVRQGNTTIFELNYRGRLSEHH